MGQNQKALLDYVLSLTEKQIDKIIQRLPDLMKIITEEKAA